MFGSCRSQCPRADQQPIASAAPASEDETTIKVAPKKDLKDGKLKLKRPKQKITNPGNWRDSSIVDGERLQAHRILDSETTCRRRAHLADTIGILYR